jgi:hypothetical protein
MNINHTNHDLARLHAAEIRAEMHNIENTAAVTPRANAALAAVGHALVDVGHRLERMAGEQPVNGAQVSASTPTLRAANVNR